MTTQNSSNPANYSSPAPGIVVKAFHPRAFAVAHVGTILEENKQGTMFLVEFHLVHFRKRTKFWVEKSHIIATERIKQLGEPGPSWNYVAFAPATNSYTQANLEDC